MNKYNDKWTREKFIEYRKLKRNGYTDSMLIEHFGDDIYESGMYNKKGNSLPNILLFNDYINEIKVNPESTDYNFTKQPSSYIKGASDYIISFYVNDNPYIISLMYFPIGNLVTYNIIFTTRDQWNEYESKLRFIIRTYGEISTENYDILEEIISRKTDKNELFKLFKNISWILFDFYFNNLNNTILSIGDTKDPIKINFYRNIIKDSFDNIKEDIIYDSNESKYFIYTIHSK